MDTQLQTLSKIFTERLFRIPDYQRGYAWQEKQLRDFWNDINQLEPGRNHYTGVLTLEPVSNQLYQKWNDDLWIIEARSFQPFYIVDGQQRLTTSIILIQTILERINHGSKLNYTSFLDIQKRFIFESKDDNDISRSYIFGYEQDNPSYEYLKTHIFGEYSTTAGDLKETIYTQNLENAKIFFKEKLKQMNEDGLGRIYKKITQNLLFNTFTIAEEVDVCVAFETMNNRGKPLSYLELLKNRLIYLSLKLQEDSEHEKQALRRVINDCWKAIYHNLGRNKNKPLDDDQFLSAHYLLYFSPNRFSQEIVENSVHRSGMRNYHLAFLLEHYFVQRNMAQDVPSDQRLTSKSINNYVKSLQVCVETWYKIFNPLETNLEENIKIWLDKINRLEIESTAPLILKFFIEENLEIKRKAFLTALERFVFILSFSDSRRILPQPFSRIISKLVSSSDSPDEIIHTINHKCHEIIENKYFMESVTAKFIRGFYRWSSIRYFLFEYNLSLQDSSKTDRPKIFWSEFNENKQDFVTVEHIFPQAHDDEYWMTRFGEYKPEVRNKLCNSLGNLLPLSKPKNSSLQNKPFPDKVGANDTSYVGYRYGCYAENEVSGYSEWTPERIREQGLKLLTFLEKRWDISLGDRNSHISLLGLDSL